MQVKFIRVFILFLLLQVSFISCLSTSCYSADEGGEEQGGTTKSKKDSELAREATTFADFFRSQAKATFKGVVFANVISTTEDYLYIKPKEKGLGRMYVYVDKHTEFSSMTAGKRKKAKKENIIDGQRIAVRVIMKEGIVLADEVFLVEGDFDQVSRYRKRVYRAAPKKEGEGGEDKKKEGGHGEAKSEEKKSGGH